MVNGTVYASPLKWLGLAAMPFGNRLRKDALRESRNRQEQNEALTKTALDFTEGIGTIKPESPTNHPAPLHNHHY
jgi:hypothetical protein